MKKKYAVSALLMMALCCPAPASAEVLKEYYPNGKIMAEMSFSFWKLDGVSKTYYESGKLMTEMNYKSGVQEGITKEYYESGKIKSAKTFKNDKPEGITKAYYETGEVMEEGTWKDGSQQFKKVFFASGKVKEYWDYNVSNPDDLANVKYYDESGALQKEQAVKQKKKKVKKEASK